MTIPFKTLFYSAKILLAVALTAFAVQFILFMTPAYGFLSNVATVAIFVLAIPCSVLGLLLVTGRLQITCPFCVQPGEMGANNRDGIWLVCESCGFIHGAGPLGLRIVREELEEDDGDEEDEDEVA